MRKNSDEETKAKQTVDDRRPDGDIDQPDSRQASLDSRTNIITAEEAGTLISPDEEKDSLYLEAIKYLLHELQLSHHPVEIPTFSMRLVGIWEKFLGLFGYKSYQKRLNADRNLEKARILDGICGLSVSRTDISERVGQLVGSRLKNMDFQSTLKLLDMFSFIPTNQHGIEFLCEMLSREDSKKRLLGVQILINQAKVHKGSLLCERIEGAIHKHLIHEQDEKVRLWCFHLLHRYGSKLFPLEFITRENDGEIQAKAINAYDRIVWRLNDPEIDDQIYNEFMTVLSHERIKFRYELNNLLNNIKERQIKRAAHAASQQPG